jgi:glycosyltransferase involved in cell wall biosynthesis
MSYRLSCVSRPAQGRAPSSCQTTTKVVLVLATYLPESFGGAEQQSRKLAIALGRLGVRVTLLAPRLLRSTAKHEEDRSITLRRFRVRRSPNFGGRYMGSFLVWGAKIIWWLVRHRREYDLIHIVHGRLHALPAVLAGSLLGKPTLIKIGRGGIEHFDLDVVSRKRLFGSWYARTIVRHATAYVANSREITEDLRRWRIPAARVHQIPNGVDLSPACVTRPSSSSIRFVYLGRLDKEKAIDLMIRGFARLPDKTRARLMIVGDGTCRHDLENLVDALEMRGHVSFAGPVDDVTAVLREADVFVSTSVSEGMSNALLEAMSFGLMPLVSLVSGVDDIVDEGRTGLMFAPGDLTAFATKLAEAIALPPETRRAFGKAARAAIIDRFGIDRVATLHLALYAELVGNAR